MSKKVYLLWLIISYHYKLLLIILYSFSKDMGNLCGGQEKQSQFDKKKAKPLTAIEEKRKRLKEMADKKKSISSGMLSKA